MVNVHSTREHIPPFKYRRICYGRSGGKLHSWSGNIFEDDSIIDDFTEDGSSWENGYKD